jgi:hypothetical protein
VLQMEDYKKNRTKSDLGLRGKGYAQLDWSSLDTTFIFFYVGYVMYISKTLYRDMCKCIYSM